MYVASPYTEPVIAPDSDPQPFDAGDGLIWVVGPVLAVVFIICIVIAILLYKKWVGWTLLKKKSNVKFTTTAMTQTAGHTK